MTDNSEFFSAGLVDRRTGWINRLFWSANISAEQNVPDNSESSDLLRIMVHEDGRVHILGGPPKTKDSPVMIVFFISPETNSVNYEKIFINTVKKHYGLLAKSLSGTPFFEAFPATTGPFFIRGAMRDASYSPATQFFLRDDGDRRREKMTNYAFFVSILSEGKSYKSHPAYLPSEKILSTGRKYLNGELTLTPEPILSKLIAKQTAEILFPTYAESTSDKTEVKCFVSEKTGYLMGVPISIILRRLTNVLVEDDTWRPYREYLAGMLTLNNEPKSALLGTRYVDGVTYIYYYLPYEPSKSQPETVTCQKIERKHQVLAIGGLCGSVLGLPDGDDPVEIFVSNLPARPRIQKVHDDWIRAALTSKNKIDGSSTVDDSFIVSVWGESGITLGADLNSVKMAAEYCVLYGKYKGKFPYMDTDSRSESKSPAVSFVDFDVVFNKNLLGIKQIRSASARCLVEYFRTYAVTDPSVIGSTPPKEISPEKFPEKFSVSGKYDFCLAMSKKVAANPNFYISCKKQKRCLTDTKTNVASKFCKKRAGREKTL